MDIQENIPFASMNWFRTGGTARYFCEPASPEDFREALEFARRRHLEVFVLGDGANILVSDEGFPGLVIRPQDTPLEVAGEEKDTGNVVVRAGSGVVIQDLIDFCLAHQLGGLEEFSGIPGTVGGAVYINLHYFEHLLSEFLVSGTVIHRETGEVQTVDPAWFRFGYDDSRLHEKTHYLVGAEFRLRKISELEAAYARGRRDETIRHRAHRYPESHTCGSFFRNFNPEEVALHVDGRPMIYVAYYLDKLGIKGQLSVGDAVVSYQHANMIVNRGTATSNDIAGLAREMQELVQERFGIVPQPECQLVGFQESPLLGPVVSESQHPTSED